MKANKQGKKAWPLGKMGVIFIVAVVLVAAMTAFVQRKSAVADIVVYKSPTCGCCRKWVEHLEDNGFSVAVYNRNDMSQIKETMGIPRDMEACHTAKIGNYVIEGHVPADAIARLVWEQPEIKGLAVPGMPMGSPGMEGQISENYDVLAMQKDGQSTIYESY